MSNEREELSNVSFGEEWERFIATIPAATIFHHPSWLNSISQTYGYEAFGLVLRDNRGDICAALPVAYINSPITGKRWISYPFSDYCFPLYREESDLLALSEHIIQFWKDEKKVPFEIRWPLPQSAEIQTNSDAVIHFLKLDSDIDKVMAGIHPMHRRNIRSAEKGRVNVEIRTSMDDIRIFYDLHQSTRRRQGVPVQPWKFFENLGKHIIQAGRGFVLLAYHQDRCIAGAVFLFQNQTVTYKYGASLRDELNLRPNNLIFWKAIQWSCENGYTLLDFGKTDIDNIGLRDFKSKWGAEENPLIYSSLSSKPHVEQNNSLHNIMDVFIRNSPLWICRLTGELLYKHFA
jgi:CelD/BcsL family acetyltransferase involved in cellulose biosynthesis